MQDQFKILIVDDNPQNIQVAAGILKSDKNKISFLGTGVNILENVKGKNYDLILLDYMMPEINGLEVLRILKNDELTRHLPVIMLTANSDTADLVACFKLGAADYVQKPFLGIELIARVNSQLARGAYEKRLLEVNTLLEKSNHELTAANNLKSRFFSIISHDLRGPVGNITSMLELLSCKENNFSPTEIEKMHLRLTKNASAIHGLLANLLEWARSQTNQIKYQPEKIDFTPFVNQTLSPLIDLAQKKKISLKFDSKEGAAVVADRNMLSCIIRNLVENAIKYTRIEGKIVVSHETQPEDIIIKIKDNGTGMSEAKAKSLFRLDQAQSTKGTDGETGSGLGLLLCKEFVDKHNGTILCHSVMGEGTEISIVLPKDLP